MYSIEGDNFVHLTSKKNISFSSVQQAHAAIEEMKSRIPNMSIGYYVNMRTVEAVYRALDIPMGDMNRGKMNGVMDEEDGEIVEEEVDNIYGHDEV